jgi:hypothetical protein
MNRTSNKSERGWIGLVACLVILGLIVGPVLIYRAAKYNSIHHETFKVEKLPNRDMQYGPDGSKNDYANLVYTDKGIFQNTDSWFPWKTRSSDVYNQLRVGKTYRCEIAGWRIGFFSMYKNIVTCDGFKYE